MEIHAGRQAFVFFAAILSGLCCGFVYDILKLTRKFAHLGSAAAAVTDFLFWTISACIVFVTIFKTACGEFRAFQFAGIILGYIIYFTAFSKWFEKFFCFFIRLIRSVLSYLLIPPAFLFKIIKILVFNTEKRCGKFGLIVMFYHRKFRKNICLIKKIQKST